MPKQSKQTDNTGKSCVILKFLYQSTSFLFVDFLIKFICLNWRLITLQCCIGFAIHQHESAMGTRAHEC